MKSKRLLDFITKNIALIGVRSHNSQTQLSKLEKSKEVFFQHKIQNEFWIIILCCVSPKYKSYKIHFFGQGLMTVKTSLVRCWLVFTSGSGNESSKQMKTMCPKCKKWKSSSLGRSQWVTLSPHLLSFPSVWSCWSQFITELKTGQDLKCDRSAIECKKYFRIYFTCAEAECTEQCSLSWVILFMYKVTVTVDFYGHPSSTLVL